MAKFNIHAGHNPDGKIGCGAVGIIKESTEARKVANEVIALLRKEGHTVYDCTCNNGTSQGDVLRKIVAKCNAHDVVLDVSIHFNAGAGDKKGNDKTTGTEVLVFSTVSKSYKYAKRIVDNIAKLGFKNRGVKVRTDLKVLRDTESPALLIECCFVDDKDDCNLYNYKTMAKAIVEGILNKEIKKAEAKATAGKKLSLKNTPCYASATTKTASSKKTGTFYLWSDEEVNGRVKITTSKDYVGKSGKVTGWIPKSHT